MALVELAVEWQFVEEHLPEERLVEVVGIALVGQVGPAICLFYFLNKKKRDLLIKRIPNGYKMNMFTVHLQE